jgi:hypothetical protein
VECKRVIQNAAPKQKSSVPFIEEWNEFSHYERKQPPSRKNLFSICLNILFQKQIAVNFPLQTYYLLYQQDELFSIFKQ